MRKYIELSPVQIDIEDNRLFAQLAFLVDSPTCLAQIKKVRDTFNIQSPFNDYKSWNNHALALAGFNIDEYWMMDKVNPEDKDWKAKLSWLQEKESNFLQFTTLQEQLQEWVVKIRKIHKYPALFDSAITQAILFNKIRRMKTAEADIAFSDRLFVHDKDDQTMYISLSPTSTKQDVLEAFEDAKQLRKEYELTNPINKNLDKDTLTNIKKVRMWHWQQHQNSTYAEVVDAWNQNLDANSKEYIFDVNKVEQAVARYRRNLQKTDI